MRKVNLIRGIALAGIFSPVAANTLPCQGIYDYVVVGSGAGGIPVADKLSASGKRVLLIERGPPSSRRWGGTMSPAWLEGTNLTRFDVPALYSTVIGDPAGIGCPDVSVLTSCVLGGGTAINGGLFMKPSSFDWDLHYPPGWRSADLAAATDRVFARVPWTYTPPADGVLHYQQASDIIRAALGSKGWEEVAPNVHPDERNMTFSRTPFMFRHGERGGVMETYLVSAAARNTFEMWTNTLVSRVVRRGSVVTGVQVESTGEGGHSGVVPLAPRGRVILSAGVFGTAKILFRSGIGPADQLQIVKAVEGGAMVDKPQWIDLPVGYGLDDHFHSLIAFRHPDIVNYDISGAYENPPPRDRDRYLANRTGILGQSTVNPVFFNALEGADAVTRHFQWTSFLAQPQQANNTAMIIVAEGSGKTSRGRVTIDSSLMMSPSTLPYVNDPGGHDFEALVSAVESVVGVISSIPGATMLSPASGQDVRSWLQGQPITAARSGFHWCGTTHLGPDSGLGGGGGTSVIDLNTQVYGTKNLHVVDASILNSIGTVNPQVAIAILAEHAAKTILALG